MDLQYSRFNYFLPASDEYPALLFNCRSTALVELSADEEDWLRSVADPGLKMSHEENGYLTPLADQGFFVPWGVDEVALVNRDFYRTTFGHQDCGITLLPTLRCNFNCTYCYSEHRPVDMTDEVIDALTEKLEPLGKQKRGQAHS